jgi:hypothetical protein
MANQQFYYNTSKYGMQGTQVEFAAKNCMDFCTQQMTIHYRVAVRECTTKGFSATRFIIYL